MEPMGRCPVCEHKVAPTCQACPSCGNTSWWRETGKRREQRARIQCSTCHGDDPTCSCRETRGVIKNVEVAEWVDTRDVRIKRWSAVTVWLEEYHCYQEVYELYEPKSI